jgi:hypothetical protein
MLDVELFSGPFEFAGDRAAGRHELGAEGAMREIQRMTLSHAPYTSYSNAKWSIHCGNLLKTSSAVQTHRKDAKGAKEKQKEGKRSDCNAAGADDPSR